MKNELSEVAFKQLIEFYKNYDFDNFYNVEIEEYRITEGIYKRCTYFDIYFYKRIPKEHNTLFENVLFFLKENCINELESNIGKPVFNSEFATEKYILNKIDLLMNEIKFTNLNYFQIYKFFSFWDYYNNHEEGSKLFDITCLDDYTDDLDIIFLRSLFYKHLINKSIVEIIKFLINLNKKYCRKNRINFMFKNSEEVCAYFDLKYIHEAIIHLIVNQISDFRFENYAELPPIYYHNLKIEINEFFQKEYLNIRQNANSVTIANQINDLTIEIEKTKFLDRKPNYQKLFSNESYLKSGLKNLLENEDNINAIRNSGKPEMMVISETKIDFDAFFKDKLSDNEMLKYDKKREEYIHLFKYEIVSEYFKNIKSFISIPNIKESNIMPSDLNKIESKDNSSNSSSEISDFIYSDIFLLESGFDKFVKCYNKFKDEKNKIVYFSSVFYVLMDKNVIIEDLGPTDFIRFLNTYSVKVISLNQLKSKENIATKTYNKVERFFNGLKI